MHYTGCRMLFLCIMVCALSIPAVTAHYDFEGIPLEVVAQGEIHGDIVTYGLYGLSNPPLTVTFTLNATPSYARTFCGVWGGNEMYTGWAEIAVNGHAAERIALGGKGDVGEEVYVSGHGVHWIAREITPLLARGENTITITTSRGVQGNRLDGRIYAAGVVAAVEDRTRPLTRYVIAEGNENLHGEGWAGTLQTRKDSASVAFGGVPDRVDEARLTVVLLATNQGQPDYVVFNGHDAGVAGDIGDERSFNAEGGAGIPTRYTDAETFDVTAYLGGDNLLTFERGRDTDGDGSISTTGSDPEGEDYIHPVFAALVLRPRNGIAAPDISLRDLTVSGAYAGETARLSVRIDNRGTRPSAMTVTWSVDGAPVATDRLTPAASGVQTATAQWPAVEGVHEIGVRVDAPGDRNAGDNALSRTITVGSLPDIVVSVGAPVRSGDAPAPTASPLPLTAALAAMGIGALAAGRSKRSIAAFIMVALVLAACTIAPACAAGSLAGYTLPVTISNTGGSDAAPFSVSVFIDGEKATVIPFDDGLAAGGVQRLDIPIQAAEGTHTIRVVASIPRGEKDQNPADNIREGEYAFL
ncbi:DUF3344 domain-containing protein [Methanofollis tationis]|uniref:DUF3344 domain-containing protein n=1 Tax=Methanofollis tationis TaxID=81417 RepID=A0A7K4HRM4_9EURY|nr:DUF3344 domain-containing protein [Methanofollis tationis]NVO67925.1 DUF3344 domain-containing protein [Methanofollis tationis]